MIQANLIPIPRRLRRLRRRRVRRWVTFCTAYSVLLVAGYGVLHAVWGHSDHVFEEDVVTVNSEIVETEREVKLVQPKLHDAQLTLAASLAVGSQPDWSVLLALLARELTEKHSHEATRQALALTGQVACLGDLLTLLTDDLSRQVMLASCELEPVRTVAPPPNATAAQSLAATQPTYTLLLSGLARSQGAISQYLLRLEQTGLFSRVTLIESKRTPFGAGEAVSFRIGCTMGK